MKYMVLIFLALSVTLVAQTSYYEYGKKVELFPTQQKRSVDNSLLSFETKDGKLVRFKKDELIVQCDEGVACDTLLNEYDFKGVSPLTKRMYLVKLQPEQSIFATIELLMGNQAIEFANPNFLKPIKRR